MIITYWSLFIAIVFLFVLPSFILHLHGFNTPLFCVCKEKLKFHLEENLYFIKNCIKSFMILTTLIMIDDLACSIKLWSTLEVVEQIIDKLKLLQLVALHILASLTMIVHVFAAANTDYNDYKFKLE